VSFQDTANIEKLSAIPGSEPGNSRIAGTRTLHRPKSCLRLAQSRVMLFSVASIREKFPFAIFPTGHCVRIFRSGE
jgi:hypothetical protein